MPFAARRALAILLAATALAAEDAPPAEGWSSTGKGSLQLSNVSTGNADTSRDPTISSSDRTSAWTSTLEARVLWRREPDSVEQNLKLQFGRSRTNDDPVSENADELRYDGIYRRTMHAPHYLYGGWHADSVFTGPEPEKRPLDPITAWLDTGYGQLYENFLPVSNRFDGRLGARLQKRWGASLLEDERSLEFGPELFLRYEQTVFQEDAHLLRWFAQYEGFTEFNDLRHVANLITAGLTAQVAKYLTLDVGLRAYYETVPKEYGNDRPAGFNEWSLRQETLVGLTYLW